MNGEQTEVAPSLSHATFLHVALTVLGAKAFRWTALVMGFTLFGYAMLRPDLYRLIAAAGFTVLTTLPLWWRRES